MIQQDILLPRTKEIGVNAVIGLAVCLYVFTIFHIFSLVFKLLYLCRERPNQETD